MRSIVFQYGTNSAKTITKFKMILKIIAFTKCFILIMPNAKTSKYSAYS